MVDRPLEAGKRKRVSSSASIVIEDLNLFYSVRHDKLHALKDVNLEVSRGEFICILGPSGCGKSTLLYILAGLLKPSSGRILLDGYPIDGPGADRAMVFQSDAIFPWLTVEQNIEYGPKIAKLPPAERQRIVDHYLELVDLKEVRHLYPRELSGGMRKRVDMARAFANSPEVLLMDEPFGMLDAMTKEHLQQSVLHIWSLTEKTVFFVTHDLEEALFLADRIVILESRPGRVHEIIPVSFERPRRLKLKLSAEFQDMRRILMETMGNLVSYSTSDGGDQNA